MKQVISRQPVRAMDAHAAEYWEVVREDDGTYTIQHGVDAALLSDAERADWEELEAMNAAFADAAPWEEAAQPEPRWATMADALLYADHLDKERSLFAEAEAFNAPMECFGDIAAHMEQALFELFSRQVKP